MSFKGRYSLDKKGVKHKTDLLCFGEQLKDLRLSFNYKQDAFAKKLGFTRTYINEIEKGKWLPSYSFFKSLTESFKDVVLDIQIEKGFITISIYRKKHKKVEIIFDEDYYKDKINSLLEELRNGGMVKNIDVSVDDLKKEVEENSNIIVG